MSDWRITPYVSNELKKLSPQDAYQQISYAHKLASVLLQLTNARQESPGEVVGELFTDWPYGFEKWLYQWLCFHFPHDSNSVTVFHSYSPIARCWWHIAHSGNEVGLLSLTHRQAKVFLQQFILPLTFDDIAVVHPGLPEKDRKAALGRISLWLDGFRSMVNHVDESQSDQRKRAKAAQRKSSARIQRSLRFILDRQLTAAVRGDDLANVRRLAQVWPPIMQSNSPNDLATLKSLIEPLENASAKHLAYLEELCTELIEKGEPWTMPAWRP